MLLSAALLTALATSPATVDERFAPRHYRSADREVPVSLWDDLLVVRGVPADRDAVAEACAKAGVDVVDERVLRKDGLFLYRLSTSERQTLRRVAAALDDAGVRAYPALRRETGRAFYDDALVISAAPGRLDAVLADVVAKVGGHDVKKSYVPYTAVVHVGAALHFDAVDASHALVDVDGLVSAEPLLYREYQLRATVNDPLFPAQWHLSRQNDDVLGTGEIFADDAWDTTKGNPGVIVAVIDSGIDVDHPDLADNMLAGFDAAGDDDDPRPECSVSQDGNGTSCPDSAPYLETHGTNVSGLIAAVGDNNLGVSGVCPRCKILPVRFLGDEAGTGLTTAETFERAVDLGADVMNNSWGPGASVYFPLSQAEHDAIEHARTAGRDGKGTVIMFAAGNETSDTFSDAYASDPYVVCVAASTNIDDWAPYSNYGLAVDVAAPSQGYPVDFDGFPDDDAGLLTTDVEGADGYIDEDYYPDFSGTSGASPVAAGVAALVLSANPALTSAQVRMVLTQTADKITADKAPWEQIIGQDLTEVFGYDETGFSIGFGYGRVNAARAVALAVAGPSVQGGSCDDPRCTVCASDGVCLERCTAQTDCKDGSVCNTAIGACELPRDRPGTFLAPCTSDCAYCTTTIDTEQNIARICTVECASDDECPSGFDCRLLEPGGDRICAVGNPNAGGPAEGFNCFSPLGGLLVTTTEEGRQVCTDICFDTEPGACPYGFACAEADCDCQGFTCVCGADDQPGIDDANDAGALCLPNPGWGDSCAIDEDCQQGDYCTADGVCRTDDRNGCNICATCTSDADCLTGRCAGLQDDGIGECVRSCEDTDPDLCPGDSVCREVDGRNGSVAHLCLSPEGGRTAADRCDTSYQCQVPCRDDVPCGDGQICDDGACVPDPNPGEGEGEGDVPSISGGGLCAGCSSNADALPFGLLALVLLPRRRRRAV